MGDCDTMEYFLPALALRSLQLLDNTIFCILHITHVYLIYQLDAATAAAALVLKCTDWPRWMIVMFSRSEDDILHRAFLNAYLSCAAKVISISE